MQSQEWAPAGLVRAETIERATGILYCQNDELRIPLKAGQLHGLLLLTYVLCRGKSANPAGGELDDAIGGFNGDPPSRTFTPSIYQPYIAGVGTLYISFSFYFGQLVSSMISFHK